MAKAAWIQTLLQRRSLWLAGVALLLLLLLGSVALSQRDWRDRASVLERENLSLQLAQLARELTAQSEQLAERTRELAESDVAQGQAARIADLTRQVQELRATIARVRAPGPVRPAEPQRR